MFAEPKVKCIMKALNTLQPSPCPMNCLFSYIVIIQSYPCHFYCAALGAVMSRSLSLKGVFPPCPWILDLVWWDENGPCTGGHSCLWILIIVKFRGDAETPQKALLWPRPPQCPQKLTARPFRGKRHRLQPATKQNRSIGLCYPPLCFRLEVFCAPGMQTHLLSLCILFILLSQKKKYDMKRWSYLHHALSDNWPSL